MLRHRWEVFFITQRPFTDGETVQRQTQRWLVAQGFDLPSVLVLRGSRGAAAAALGLDYHVDDRPQNCVDVDRRFQSQNDSHRLRVEHGGDRQREKARDRRGPQHQRCPGHPRPGDARVRPIRSLFRRIAKMVGMEMKQSAVGNRQHQSSRESESSVLVVSLVAVLVASLVAVLVASSSPQSRAKKRPEATFASGHPSNLVFTSSFNDQHSNCLPGHARAEADDARRDDAADVVRRQRRRRGPDARRRVERGTAAGGARGSRSSWSG